MFDGADFDGIELMDTDAGRDGIDEAPTNQPPSVKGTKSFHPYLTGMCLKPIPHFMTHKMQKGHPCDQNSIDFPDGILPTPMPEPENVAEPFEDLT